MKKFVSGIMAGIILALCISVFAQNAEIIIEKLPLKYILTEQRKFPPKAKKVLFIMTEPMFLFALFLKVLVKKFCGMKKIIQ